MNRYDDILLVLLGWALGALAPSLVDGIKRSKQKTELLAAIQLECADLRYKAAIVSHRLRGVTGTMTRESLDRVKPIILGHKGPQEDQNVADSFRKLLAAAMLTTSLCTTRLIPVRALSTLSPTRLRISLHTWGNSRYSAPKLSRPYSVRTLSYIFLMSR